MLSARMFLNLSANPCTFLSSAFFRLLLCTERQGKSRIFPPEVSGQDQEVLPPKKCPPTIPEGRGTYQSPEGGGVPSSAGCCPLSDRAVLAVCRAVYYRHLNNLSQRLITWKGNQSCGSSLKSMPISLALGRGFCFFCLSFSQ